MKLFVDDMRECPEGWTLARSTSHAIRLLHTTYVEVVSLDYDIRCGHATRKEHCLETFEPVARFIALMPSKPKVEFHTGNSVGRENMKKIIKGGT